MKKGRSSVEVDEINNTSENRKRYSASEFNNTYYLGYRDLPTIFKRYRVKGKAIDYGCGAGRSTRFLRKLGFQATGVDINRGMLEEATCRDKVSSYFLIESGRTPFLNDSYDLFFSCFVFFVIPSLKELMGIFKEAYRCLKRGGFFIFVTGSEELYRHEWLSYTTDFEGNKHLESGDEARIYLKDLGIEYVNYLWKEADYESLGRFSGFQIQEKEHPLGRLGEGFVWETELEYAPYVIYILRKG